MQISFIIPAFNEEDNIEATLQSIREYGYFSNKHVFETLVIDNGSTDNTVQLANRHGAKVFVLPGLTIAGLRNHGASEAKGDIYIFIDADTLLTREWGKNIELALNDLRAEEILVTGSHVLPEKGGNWFLKYWFKSIAEECVSNHIGSAHMIVTRSCFERLGGFNSKLVTAEDFDFCQRAKSAGGTISNNRELPVYHADFPTTPKQFFMREMWHGEGDCSNLKTALSSKSLQASIMYYMFLGWLVLSIVTVSSFTIPLVLICSLLLLSSWSKFRHSGLKTVAANTLIMNIYLIARGASVLRSLLRSVRSHG